jgi:hypothetical protein
MPNSNSSTKKLFGQNNVATEYAIILVMGIGCFRAKSHSEPFETIKMPTTFRELIRLTFAQRTVYFEGVPKVAFAVSRVYAAMQSTIDADIARLLVSIAASQQLAERNSEDIEAIQVELARLQGVSTRLAAVSGPVAQMPVALAARVAPCEQSPNFELPIPGKYQKDSKAIALTDPIEKYWSWLEERGGLIEYTRLEGIAWLRLCESHVGIAWLRLCESHVGNAREVIDRRTAFKRHFGKAVVVRLHELADRMHVHFQTEWVTRQAINATNNVVRHFCNMRKKKDRYAGLKHLEDLVVETFASRHVKDEKYRLNHRSVEILHRNFFYRESLPRLQDDLFKLRGRSAQTTKIYDTFEEPKENEKLKEANDKSKEKKSLVAAIEKSLTAIMQQEIKLNEDDRIVLYKATEKIQYQIVPREDAMHEDFQVPANHLDPIEELVWRKIEELDLSEIEDLDVGVIEKLVLRELANQNNIQL